MADAHRNWRKLLSMTGTRVLNLNSGRVMQPPPEGLGGRRESEGGGSRRLTWCARSGRCRPGARRATAEGDFGGRGGEAIAGGCGGPGREPADCCRPLRLTVTLRRYDLDMSETSSRPQPARLSTTTPARRLSPTSPKRQTDPRLDHIPEAVLLELQRNTRPSSVSSPALERLVMLVGEMTSPFGRPLTTGKRSLSMISTKIQ
jgi:hypothetical protein